MKTLEEKQIEVKLFLRNEEKSTLAKLEKTISGKSSFIDFAWPCVITFLLGGLLYLEYPQPQSSPLLTLAIFIGIVFPWISAVTNINQKQTYALKKYFDLKLRELEKKIDISNLG